MRCDSSSSDERLSTGLVQYRFAVKQCRLEEELGATIATLEAELAGGSVDSQKDKKSSGTIEGQEEPEGEGFVLVETHFTRGGLKRGASKKSRPCFHTRSILKSSEAWDEELKTAAVAKLQQQLDSSAAQVQELCQWRQRCEWVQRFKVCETSDVHVKDRSALEQRHGFAAKPSVTRKEILQAAQEGLQRQCTKKLWTSERRYSMFRTKSRVSKKTQEGRRTSDAVECSKATQHASSCGWAAAGICTVLEDEQKNAVATRHHQSRTTQRAREVRAFQCRGGKVRGVGNRTAAHGVRCRRSKPGATTGHTCRIARSAFG